MQSQTYFSDNLSFIASALLCGEGKVTISSVTLHSSKPGVKVFHLTPKNEAERLFKLYVSDGLRVSPSLLTSKIAELRYIPAENINSTPMRAT